MNASQSSIKFQWPSLTDVLGNQLRAYVALVETTSGEKVAGNIVFLNVTSVTIYGLKGATEYRVSAVVVDVLGQPHRSSQVLASTEEGGECGEPKKKNEGKEKKKINMYRPNDFSLTKFRGVKLRSSYAICNQCQY